MESAVKYALAIAEKQSPLKKSEKMILESIFELQIMTAYEEGMKALENKMDAKSYFKKNFKNN